MIGVGFYLSKTLLNWKDTGVLLDIRTDRIAHEKAPCLSNLVRDKSKACVGQ